MQVQSECEVPATPVLRAWTGDGIEDDAWTPDARRATLVIQSSADQAIAILIDDGSPPRHYALPADQVPSFLAAATQAWSRDHGHKSLAVVWNTGLEGVIIGTVGGPGPGPGPGPAGGPELSAVATLAHHQLLAFGEVAYRNAQLLRVI